MQLRSGVKLGRVAGIEINADWSLLIIFALIAFMLAQGVFAAWHPGWSAATAWGTALAAAALFLASILLHELSHALAGRLVGISIRRITLFIFGGMSHMDNEPPSWRAELGMALAGPVTSLILGFVFLLLAGLAAGTGTLVDDPREAMATLSPLATLLLWLGPVNLVLGIFNLVPGFPLDGGRVLRALLWAATGNLARATRWASLSGQAFAWLLMGTGILMVLGLRLPVLGGGTVNGLWLAFIGWFLNNAASASYRQIRVRELLERVPVSRLMQTKLVSVPPDLTISQLLDEILIPSGQRAFPVRDGTRLLGMVFLGDLHQIARSKWPVASVSDSMIPVPRLISVTPETDALEALSILGTQGFNQLPVIDHGILAGLLRREDLLTWLSLYSKSR